MTDSTEVKAHVKLRFQNRSNRTCVAVRSLQVTRKKTKLEFKALEGVLRTTDDNDEKVSISMKCSDMDRMLPENLGVSPAILENVIFVHQEDSNWPMQDSKTLKQRFDDVFESTRYTKALEALMKTRKEFQSKSKDLKVELAELNGHVMQANQFKIELEKLQEQEEEYHGKLTEILDRLKVTDGKLSQTSEIMGKVKTHHDDIKRTEWEIQDKKSRIQEKLSAIKELLDHQDDFTIQQALDNLNMIMFTKQNELIKTTDQMRAIEKEIQVIRTNQIEPLQIKKGQAALLQKQVEENQSKQITLLNQYKKKYPQNTVLLNVTMVTKDNYRENMVEQMASYLQREVNFSSFNIYIMN
jgi:DNA repair protein RAD50